MTKMYFFNVLCYAFSEQLGQFFRNGFISCFQCFNDNLIFSRFFQVFVLSCAAFTSHIRIQSMFVLLIIFMP